MSLKVPIYFSAGLTIQANMYYKVLINWTSQKVKDAYTTRNAFDFKHVCSFERSLINAPGPCVLFATPGMISGGFSLEVFKHWAPYEENLITLPGYCVAGTVGHKLMSGKSRKVDVDRDTQVDVRCKIHQLSFSPHTDAKGIMDLVKFLSPKHVILVHGEKPKMISLQERIQSELGIQSFCPANNETVSIPSTHYVKADISDALRQNSKCPNFKFSKTDSGGNSNTGFMATPLDPLRVSDDRVTAGILCVDKSKKAKVVHQDEFLAMLGAEKHELQFAYCCQVRIGNLGNSRNTEVANVLPVIDNCSWLHLLIGKLAIELSEVNIQDCGEHIQVESVRISVCLNDDCPHRMSETSLSKSEAVYFCCTWLATDEQLAMSVISMLRKLELSTN